MNFTVMYGLFQLNLKSLFKIDERFTPRYLFVSLHHRSWNSHGKGGYYKIKSIEMPALTKTNIKMIKGSTTLVFILASISIFGQDWLVPGASWTYCRFWPGDSPQEYVYTQDSIVNDTSYALIENVSINGQPAAGNEWYDLRTTLLRQSGDTTYRRVNDMEYIFFVDDLEVGDGFTTYRSAAFYTEYFTCISEMYLEVQEVYFEEIEGELFRYVVLEDTAFAEVYGIPDDPTAENIFTFIEGMGLRNNFPYWNESTFPFETHGDFSCSLSTDGYERLRLARYSNPDEDFVLFNCGLTSVEDRELKDLKIWPNPATERIHIEASESILSVQLLDPTGKVVSIPEYVPGAQTLELRNVPQGLYLLKCVSAHGLALRKIVVSGS